MNPISGHWCNLREREHFEPCGCVCDPCYLKRISREKTNTMDPDETLNCIRDIIDTVVDPNYDELVNLFESLDDWLCGGGFLPHDWKWRGSGCK